MLKPSKYLRSGVIATLLGLVALVAPSETAWAACAGRDIKGTYEFYQILGGNFSGRTEVEVVNCVVKVRSSGAVAANFACVRRSNIFGAGRDDLTGGKLAVGRSCKVTENIRFGEDKGEECKNSLTRAWMAKDKNTISGVGADCDGRVFQFTAVKH